MKRLTLLALLCCVSALAFQAFAQTEPALVLKGLDPVRLIEGREVPGSATHSRTHGAFRYQFESAETLARFAADPERFAVAKGGECATMPGAAGSPELFAVHGGKIYLFGGPGCRQAFLATPGLFTDEIKRRQVAIVVYEGVELLDFAGPGEVFASAGHGGGFDVTTVGASKTPVVSQGFVTVTPEHAITDAPAPDILVIPGGGIRALVTDPAMMAWIKTSAAKAEIVLSVCNGALVLARLGLLEDLSATTHHGSIAALRREAPNSRVEADARFVDNGKVVTAAGVSAGIDASLHIVERLFGAAQAADTARYMEYQRLDREGEPVAAITTTAKR